MDKEVIIERKRYIDILDKAVDRAGRNIAIIGPRYSGKTTIVKNYLEKNASLKERGVFFIYVDLSKIGMSPESFAAEFIDNIKKNFSSQESPQTGLRTNRENFFSEIKARRWLEIESSIENELQKIKPDQRFLVQQAFAFLPFVANDLNRKFVLVLDNFEYLLDLNNFNQVKDVLALVNFNQQNVQYIVTSSVSQVKKLLRNFEFQEIQNFDNDEVAELAKKYGVEQNEAGQKFLEEIFALSDGIPIVVVKILEHLQEKNDLKEKNDALASFFSQLLVKNNSLYDYCSSTLDYCLNWTSGKVLSKIILKVIASNEGLRLSEIARKIYRPAPVTKILLERLISSDLVYRKSSRFYISNPVLGLWIRLVYSGYEFDYDITEEELKEVLSKVNLEKNALEKNAPSKKVRFFHENRK